MPRSTAFSREPFKADSSLDLQYHRVHGPFSFLNPTRATFRRHSDLETSADGARPDAGHQTQDETPKKEDEQLASDIEFKWRSRDNRKGRHTLVIDPTDDPAAPHLSPKPTSTASGVMQGIHRMFTQFPYWDISWLVATIFTLGSCVWVINAFFAYLPLVDPKTEFHDELLYGGGISAFIGATIFEIGSVLLMFEAVNENREGCFGWALERVVSGDHGDKGKIRVRADKGRCTHHHTNRNNLVGKGKIEAVGTASPSGTIDSSGEKVDGFVQDTNIGRGWVWFPSWHELRSHYLRELGFLACFAQLCGATIFWISGFTALPGIINEMSQGLIDGVYWAPQIIGGTGFIISGLLFMIETQSVWWKPAFGVLGWHIGFWNLIGALGFTLCGALGPAYGNSGAAYEASLATFWGSWAFLIGSTIQWYESLDKHPVETMKGASNPESAASP